MTTMREAFEKWAEGDSLNESGVARDAFEAGYAAASAAAPPLPPEGWRVKFGIGNQFFTLDYRPETRDEAEWMVKQLEIALNKAKSQSSVPLVFLSAAPEFKP